VRTVAHRSIPILAVLAPMLLSSCGIWDSFTAYFNTFYNAQDAYTKAEEEVWAMPETRESGHNLLIPLNISQGAKTKFTAVIEKCSKLLQYHPDASLVDDALMMIGRSYYYQNEFQKAERKFKELIDGYPNSDLALEAQVLMAFGYYKSNDLETAAKTAQHVLDLAAAAGANKIVAEASLVLGQIALDQKAYARARTFFMRVGELGDTSEKRAQALMKVGEMYALEKNFVAAQEAYQRAYALSGSYLGEYRALLGGARMLNMQHRFDAAHDALLGLRSNSNYREFFGQIDYELGNVALERGNLLEAVTQFAYVDTAYARTEAAADANLALGLIYETVLFQYDSARTVYERGRGATNTAASRVQIVRRADYLSRYIAFRNDIVKLDSLRYAALHPVDSVAAGMDSVRADSLLAARVDTSRIARADSTKPRAPQPPPMSLDTINVRLVGRMDDIAGLFYATMGMPDSARFWYRRVMREFPDSRVAPRALYVLARIEGEDSTNSRTISDSLHREIVRRFPESPFAEESKRLLGLPPTVKTLDPLDVSYRNATSLLQSGKSTAAIDSFKALVRLAPASPLAPRALYAVGWTYEYHTTLMDSAAATYERLVALYPNSAYAQRVQPRVAEIQSARQAALAPKKTDSTSVVAPPAPIEKPAEKKSEVLEEESLSKRKRPATAPGTEKLDTPSEILDERNIR
jgi:TolA-binding protein